MARGGRTGEHAVVRRIRVAVIASGPQGRMPAGVDRKAIVRKPCAGPLRCRVAFRTVLGEIAANVIRVRGGAVILRVAGIAIRRQAGILPAPVAIPAGEFYMGPGKRKLCIAVIVRRTQPGIG